MRYEGVEFNSSAACSIFKLKFTKPLNLGKMLPQAHKKHLGTFHSRCSGLLALIL